MLTTKQNSKPIIELHFHGVQLTLKFSAEKKPGVRENVLDILLESYENRLRDCSGKAI